MEQIVYQEQYSSQKRKLYSIQAAFELTPRCNFNCKMCYVHLNETCLRKYGRELTASEWIRRGEQAVDAVLIKKLEN